MSSTSRAVRRALGLFALTLVGLFVGTPASADPAPEIALGGIRQVGAGNGFSCALLTSSEARCWGSDAFQLLGNGPGFQSSTLARPVVGLTGTGRLTGLTQLSSGPNGTCARTNTGQARCWGYGLEGALGDGQQTTPDHPVAVSAVTGTGRLTGVVEVATGWGHACARVTGGQVRCWGANDSGELGTGNNTPSPRPVVVKNPAGTGPLTGVTQIAAGLSSTCARLNTGRAVCWGENGSAQLGVGAGSDRNRPSFVSNAAGTGVLTGVAGVSIGYTHGCARLTSGQARCWGATPDGQEDRPTGVSNGAGTGPLTGITGLVTAFQQSCATVANGGVRCWGTNAKGQLGDRSLTFRARAVAMVAVSGAAPISGVTSIGIGQDHTCVRLGTGQAACVGTNTAGMLGDGTHEATTRPVQVKR